MIFSSKGGFVTDSLPLLKNTTRESSESTVTFDICNQRNDNDKIIARNQQTKTNTMTMTFREYTQRAIPETECRADCSKTFQVPDNQTQAWEMEISPVAEKIKGQCHREQMFPFNFQ